MASVPYLSTTAGPTVRREPVVFVFGQRKLPSPRNLKLSIRRSVSNRLCSDTSTRQRLLSCRPCPDGNCRCGGANAERQRRIQRCAGGRSATYCDPVDQNQVTRIARWWRRLERDNRETLYRRPHHRAFPRSPILDFGVLPRHRKGVDGLQCVGPTMPHRVRKTADVELAVIASMSTILGVVPDLVLRRLCRCNQNPLRTVADTVNHRGLSDSLIARKPRYLSHRKTRGHHRQRPD